MTAASSSAVTAAGRDWNTLPDDAFRHEIASFIEAQCPPSLRHVLGRRPWAEVRPWYESLSRAGMIAPAWPVSFGGMGLTPEKHLVFLEEFERAGCPWMPEQGTMNVGPALILHGTPEQQQRYLPRILSGDDIWCQGFSEPNAGSDLASLRTEARIEGDELVINGQKTWTSGAHNANKIFALVRTDKTVRKQAGISFVLMDLRQPGITIRSVRTIDGESHFNETFFDNARAKVADVVGGLNNGWKVANSLLGSERLWAGSPRHAVKYLTKLDEVRRALEKTDDPAIADRHAQLVMDTLDLAAAYRRTVSQLDTGTGYGFEASVLKIWQTELSQRIMELAIEVADEAGGLADGARMADRTIDLLFPFLETRPPTIYGGSVEIHRNILAKNVLKLPM